MDFEHLEEEYVDKLLALWNEHGKGKFDSVADFAESDDFAAAGLLRELEGEIRGDLEDKIEQYASETLEAIVIEATDRLSQNTDEDSDDEE